MAHFQRLRWEPIESFNTHETINEFWKKTGDRRDVFDIQSFKAGEVFIPRGPRTCIIVPSLAVNVRGSTTVARKMKKKKSEVNLQAETSAQGAQASSASAPIEIPSSPEREPESPTILDLTVSDLPVGGSKRRRGIMDSTTSKQPPQKRSRRAPASTSVSAPVRTSRRKSRAESPDVVPDSDEEAQEEMEVENGIETRDSSRSAQEVASNLEFAPPSPPATDKPDSLFDDKEDGDVPAHRRRQQKPLVKVFEDPSLQMHDGQLVSKAKAVASKRAESSSKPSPSKSRRGPGRSSAGMKKATLLTAVKGTLKSVRTSARRHSKTEKKSEEPEQDEASLADNEPLFGSPEPEAQAPPTGKELLDMAGLDNNAVEDLPDFEEVAPPAAPSPEAQERAESLRKAQESLFPAPALEPELPEKMAWTKSTIFGPL